MTDSALKRPISRLAYRAPEAAAVLGVSKSKFEDWVKRGIMPKPFKIDDVTLYSVRALEAALLAIEDGETGAIDSTNPYDKPRA